MKIFLLYRSVVYISSPQSVIQESNLSTKIIIKRGGKEKKKKKKDAPPVGFKPTTFGYIPPTNPGDCVTTIHFAMRPMFYQQSQGSSYVSESNM